MNCPKCGYQTENENCPVCGVNIAAATAEANAPVAPRSTKPAHGLLKFLIGLVAVIAVIVVLCNLGNNYKRPVRLSVKYTNSVIKNEGKTDYKDAIKYIIKLCNGIEGNKIKKMYHIIKKSDNFDSEESVDMDIYDYYDFDKNVRFHKEITDKEKLDDDELNDERKSIKEEAKYFIDKYEEILEDDDSLEDFADDLGLTKAQTKKLVKLIISYYEDLKDCKVTAGYEIEYDYNYSGVDEDYEDLTEGDGTDYVYKVDGKWVSADEIISAPEVLVDMFEE